MPEKTTLEKSEGWHRYIGKMLNILKTRGPGLATENVMVTFTFRFGGWLACLNVFLTKFQKQITDHEVIVTKLAEVQAELQEMRRNWTSYEGIERIARLHEEFAAMMDPVLSKILSTMSADQLQLLDVEVNAGYQRYRNEILSDAVIGLEYAD